MEAKGEISMRMVHCEDCGKRYDYDVDGFCPRCGAFNQPAGDGDAPQLEKKPEFQQREKPAARGRKRAHSAAKEGGLLLGLEVVSDLAVDLVEMPFLTCSPDRLCRAPNGI